MHRVVDSLSIQNGKRFLWSVYFPQTYRDCPGIEVVNTLDAEEMPLTLAHSLLWDQKEA